MGVFEPEQPDWLDLPWVEVTGPARILADGAVALESSAGTLEFSLLDNGLRLRAGRRRELDYGLLVTEPAPVPPSVDSSEAQSRIEAGDGLLVIDHSPFAFHYERGGRTVQHSPSDGHFTRRFRLPPLAQVGKGWFLSLELRSNEPVYGLGEKWGRLDKRGQLLRSWNRDAYGVNEEISYKNTPFAWSPLGWGVFVHTPSAVTHGVGYAPWSQRAYGVLVEDAELDLFLLDGEGGADLIRGYTDLTGRSPMPPLWSTGVILSRAYYRDAGEILAVAREVRERGMPCDVMTFDGRAWQDTDTRFAFEWDPDRYLDPAPVIAELKALGFKLCVWEYPLISVRHPWFQEFADKGWLLTDRRDGEAWRYHWETRVFGPVLTALPESGLVDFTHPEAYAFWRDAHKPLFDLGIDMIKADFGEQVDDDNMMAHNGERGRALHNVYAHLYNRCVYEASERYGPSGAFLFSRSSWTGCQRFPSQWGGDPQADWGGMAGNIRGGLSWGLSGGPFYATDIGGFYGDQRNDELYVRWAQAGVFSAHIRLHGIGPREPWSYGPEAERAVLAALALRYRLVPYLRKTMQQSVTTGLPVQRPMVLAFPKDRAAWAFDDQFMFGADLLVVPCLDSGGAVEFYLPAGNWHRFPEGNILKGGRVHRLALALDEMAVFAREGARIFLAPEVQSTVELESLDESRLQVWEAAEAGN